MRNFLVNIIARITIIGEISIGPNFKPIIFLIRPKTGSVTALKNLTMGL